MVHTFPLSEPPREGCKREESSIKKALPQSANKNLWFRKENSVRKISAIDDRYNSVSVAKREIINDN